MFKKFIFACIGVVLAQAALATPSRLVELKETILGQSDTNIFVLRHIRDNLGYHGTFRDEFYLVSRDFMTGEEERVWPVMRSLDHGQYYFQNNEPERFVNLGAGERVNPFDILLWRRAYNLNPTIYPAEEYWRRVSISGSDIIVTEQDTDTATPAAPLLERLVESLEHTSSILPADDLGSPWFDEISWQIGRIGSEEGAFTNDCEIGGQVYIEKPLETDLRPVLVRLDCQNGDEDSGGFSYWAVLPPQKDNY